MHHQAHPISRMAVLLVLPEQLSQDRMCAKSACMHLCTVDMHALAPICQPAHAQCLKACASAHLHAH